VAAPVGVRSPNAQDRCKRRTRGGAAFAKPHIKGPTPPAEQPPEAQARWPAGQKILPQKAERVPGLSISRRSQDRPRPARQQVDRQRRRIRSGRHRLAQQAGGREPSGDRPSGGRNEKRRWPTKARNPAASNNVRDKAQGWRQRSTSGRNRDEQERRGGADLADAQYQGGQRDRHHCRKKKSGTKARLSAPR